MSATRPWASTWPRSMIATEVHSSSSSGRMWDETRMVLPSDRSSRRSSRSSTRARGSRPDAGSSSRSTGRIVDQRVREAEPLLHAAREPRDVGVALGPQVHQLQQVADHAPPPLGVDAVAAGEEVQVLPDLHVVVDPERVRHEPEDAPDVVRVPAHGGAGDLRVAAVGDEQRGEDAQGRGLAGAVRADEAEDLALRDVEVQAGDGEGPVVALDEPRGAGRSRSSDGPFERDGELEPDAVLARVDELDLELAAGRVHPPGRRPRARRRRPACRCSNWTQAPVRTSRTSSSGRPSWASGTARGRRDRSGRSP